MRTGGMKHNYLNVCITRVKFHFLAQTRLYSSPDLAVVKSRRINIYLCKDFIHTHTFI